MEVQEKTGLKSSQKSQNIAGNTAGCSWIGWKQKKNQKNYVKFTELVGDKPSAGYNQKSLSAKNDKSNLKIFVYLPPTSHQEPPGITSLISQTILTL